MPIEPSLADNFKPEERKRGEDLFAEDVVILSSATDTTVKAMIKMSGAPRLTLNADDVASPRFHAACSCTSFAKGTLCKHLWATLLKLEQRDADFLSGKTDVDLVAREVKSGRTDRQKERYEEHKARAKELRRELKNKKSGHAPKPRDASIYPEPVTEALAYFKDNGFDMSQDLDLDAVINAKRILSRVFHPDKGGTHDEAVTLNENFEILKEYLNA